MERERSEVEVEEDNDGPRWRKQDDTDQIIGAGWERARLASPPLHKSVYSHKGALQRQISALFANVSLASALTQVTEVNARVAKVQWRQRVRLFACRRDLKQ